MKLFLVLLFTLPSWLMCNRTNQQETPIAQVGPYQLLPEQVQGMLETSPPLEDLQKSAFVHRWIEQTLMRLEAERMGLDEQESFQRRLEATTTQMLANDFLEYKLDKLSPPTQAELKDYYERHKQDFVRTQREIGVRELVVGTWGANRRLKALIDRGEPFDRINNELAGDILEYTDYKRMPFEDFATGHKRRLEEMKPGEAGGPVIYDQRFYYFQYVENFPVGSALSFDDVKDLLPARAALENRQKMRRELLRELRQKHPVVINLDKMP